MRKKFLLLFISVVSLAVKAETVNYDNVKYTMDGDVAYVSGHSYDGPVGEITLKSEATFYVWSGDDVVQVTVPVTRIASDALASCNLLTKVIVPKGITAIEKYAFFDCRELKSVVLPDGLTTLGESAFSACSELEEINLPNTLTSIGNNVLDGCGFTSFTIPGFIKHIPDAFMYYCPRLKSVTIEEGVESLGISIFTSCESLETIILPNSLKEIGYASLSSINALKKISIPSNVEIIGASAFTSCNGLETVDFSQAKNLKSIGKDAFVWCESLINIDLSGCTNLKTIDDGGFRYCSSLSSFLMPEGLETIGIEAFSNCPSLVSMSFPASITDIGKYTFWGCSGLQYIDISKCLLLGAMNVSSWAFDRDIPEETIIYAPNADGFMNDGPYTVIFGPFTNLVLTCNTADANNPQQWYDLKGSKLQQKPTQKGVYILNGRKVVVE
jgi:hypothetical protein